VIAITSAKSRVHRLNIFNRRRVRGSSENVRAYSATTKRMEPLRLLKAIFTWEMTTPTSSASSGDGGRRIGAGLSLDENRPDLYRNPAFNNLI
jgi:hypothetical protein